MTTTIDEPDVADAGSVLPPTHYPHRDWADDPDDPYHVPAELRADYAVVNPPDRMIRAFWSSGASRAFYFGWDAMVSYAHERGAITDDDAASLAAGDFTTVTYQKLVNLAVRVSERGRAPASQENYNKQLDTTTYEPVPKGMALGFDLDALTFIVEEHVEGPEGFVEWIHGERYELAERAVARRRETAETAARQEAAKREWIRTHTCPSCSALSEDDLRPVAAPGPLAARARLCTLCRSHAERIILDAETVNGRPRREVVTDYLDHLSQEG